MPRECRQTFKKAVITMKQTLHTYFSSVFTRPFGRRASQVFYLLCPVLSFYLLEFLTHNPFEDIHAGLQLFSWLLYLLFYSLCFLAAGRMRTAYFLATFLVMGVGIANYFTTLFRSSPLLPWDVRSLGIAISVADNQSFELTPALAGITAGFILLMLFSLRCRLQAPARRPRLATAAGALALMAALVFGLQTDAMAEALDIYEMPFTQWYTYRQNGFLVSYLMNTKYLSIEVPASYNVKNLEETVAGAAEEGGEAFPAAGGTAGANGAASSSGAGQASAPREKQDTLPNLIVIMNEAFSDLSVLGDFETNKDYMPFFRSLKDNAISGHSYVSVLGGNTANSEFEFLTGDSMAFLPLGSVPYQQYVHSSLPSLVDVLKEQGYYSVAMHPYYASGWEREDVYDYLGFDEKFFLEDFEEAPLLRQYVSDWGMYQKVIDLYESKEEGQPLFLFGVTMQNHSGYAKEYDNFSVDVNVLNGDYPCADTYLSLIGQSDQAYERLIQYFSQAEEDTVILMFGDHQPTSLENGFFTDVLGNDPLLLTLEETALRYQTPFKIWANFDIPEAEDEAISLNYLSSLLLHTAGLSLSDYQEYLWNVHETLPVVTAHFYMDESGRLYGYEDEEEGCVPAGYLDLLADYSGLQYNHLFDKQNQLTKLFLLTKEQSS